MKHALNDEVRARLEQMLAPQIGEQLDPQQAPKTGKRRPVGVLYGGAHRFTREAPRKLGRMARAAFERWMPDATHLSQMMNFPESSQALAHDVHKRLAHKLNVAPIEDLRIDFEDGLGPISDVDEDKLANKVGVEAAYCVYEKNAPPFFGIRPKALGPNGGLRALRTLSIFFGAYHSTLQELRADASTSETGVDDGVNLVVTLPKVESAREVEIAALALGEIEKGGGPARIGLEVMIESARGLFDADGRMRVPDLVRAGKGRVVGVHFGTYDYSASIGIAAPHQRADHPACELARQLLQASCCALDVVVSDGATHEMPIGPHRGQDLAPELEEENRVVVEHALRLHAGHITRALENGIDLGWDLHPTQLLARYAATFAFYRKSLAAMTLRMKTYVERGAEAALSGTMFDDAASANGVFVFFLRGFDCGAIDKEELVAAGLSSASEANRSLSLASRA